MTAVTQLVDLPALAGWMDTVGLGEGEIEGLRPLSGGTQNVLVRFRRGGVDYVLRRGPEHLRARSNQSILREIAMVGALATTDVPHARLIAACEDPTVLHGAVFYLMEPVEGYNAAVSLPRRAAADRELRYGMGLRLIDALAGLASVDHIRIGLGAFGRPEGFLERQVARWLSELESFSHLAGYPGPDIPGLERVASWLESNRPVQASSGILHGDYHVANVMYAPGGPDVTAIVDWEMSTIGDPLLDLGALLAVWPEADGEPDLIASELSRAGGLPDEAALVASYAERSDRDLRALDWYVVLASFKLGIVLEGTYARAQAGKADPATGDRLHALTLILFERALRRCAA
jgi:aminoglycoside phosphotransferase (APT) family kinase protein